MMPWNLKATMLQSIANRGGFVNCHAHIDKAFYISKDALAASMLDMEKKWHMSDSMKRAASEQDIYERIAQGTEILIEQGCRLSCSFIDAYEAVGEKAIRAALRVKEDYKDKIDVRFAPQPLGGLVDASAIALFERVVDKCDYVGGLPSVDRPNDAAHYDALFSIAKNQRKKIHVHIDQENNPHEKDTEKLVAYTKKHGYEGNVVAVHSISTAAQEKPYRTRLYKEMAALGIGVVVCPSAALAMKQLDQYTAPVHNSIANVPEMIAAGITVALGIDNIYDFYQPFVDGDMWVEMRMLQEACRYYDFDQLVNIATDNGRQLLDTQDTSHLILSSQQQAVPV